MRLVRDRVAVRVPATSANLGPGFDAFGLALELHDVVRVAAISGQTRVEVTGEGAGEVPDGEDHLIVRALRVGLDHVGAPQAGFAMTCANAIPHGRGLGSSAAAVVAGLVAARGLISDPEALDNETVLALATEFEGHPDNAAPALLGGATIAWHDDGGVPHAAGLEVAAAIALTVLVPTGRLATHRARAALAATVPHEDAAFNAGRSGLLTLALMARPDLLWDATADRLHQDQRASVMPESMELVRRLRAAGLPTVISGAGPSVLVFGEVDADIAGSLAAGWDVARRTIDRTGACLIEV